MTISVALLASCGTGSTGDTASTDGSTAAVAASPSPTESLLPESTSSSAVGTLAPGFPVTLLPVPADADILVSAADPVAGSTDLQVSLNLRSSLAASDLIALYRAPLLAAGFLEAPSDQSNVSLAAQATFTRSAGDEILVLGVLDRDGVRTLTLGGRLHQTA